jgi:undecaprenyl-diphosphatase
MHWLTVIILGFVQGVTEFIPVSSSGHLVIAQHLLGNSSSFELDVLLNFGTLLALVIYFRKRIFGIISDVFIRRDFHLVFKLIVATIPALAVGFLFQGFIENSLQGPWIVVIMLTVVGVLMIMSKNWQPKKALAVNNDLHKASYKHSLLIGLAQCVSLISGTSRSGSTILAALKLGYSKEKAAEWSFLMGIPIILGASLKILAGHKGMDYVQTYPLEFLVANVVSFISGMAAIHYLMKLLQQKGLYWFGWYRLALAVVLIILISVKIV